MNKIFSQTKSLISDWKQALAKKHENWTHSLIAKGEVNLSNMNLTSLEETCTEDARIVKVVGNYYCHNNQLTSLKGGPEVVTGIYCCTGNKLTSLEGAPHKFKKLITDFGVFNSWKDVPAHLRREPPSQKDAGGLNL